jgi:hypothetical protein
MKPLAACAALIALAPGLLASSSLAQAPGVAPAGGPPRILKIDKVSLSKQPTPEYEVKRISVSGSKTRQWLQIAVKYQTAPDWIDELNFRYYALVKVKQPAPGQPAYVCFSGAVDYVNIAKGSHEADIYLHPSTLARFGDVEQVAVQVFAKGQLVGMEPANPVRFWEQLPPQSGFLLNRMETPFAMVAFDNYEAMKGASTGR